MTPIWDSFGWTTSRHWSCRFNRVSLGDRHYNVVVKADVKSEDISKIEANIVEILKGLGAPDRVGEQGGTVYTTGFDPYPIEVIEEVFKPGEEPAA